MPMFIEETKKMQTFHSFLDIINENLVLKRRPTQDGKFEFVVDSDIADKKEAGNETYQNRSKIKIWGLFGTKV